MSEEGHGAHQGLRQREMDATMVMSSGFSGPAGRASDLPGREFLAPGAGPEVAAGVREGRGR